MKNIFKILFMIAFILSSSRVGYSWCFLLPNSITYATSLDALNAGYAVSRKDAPSVDDFADGKLLMANIHSMDSFELVLWFADGSSELIVIPKGHALGLTADKKSYFFISVTVVPKDQALNTRTDFWSAGNWVLEGEFNNALVEYRTVTSFDGSTKRVPGGYIHLTPSSIKTLKGVPVRADLQNFIRFGNEHYAKAADVPSLAAETAFTSAAAIDVPIVKDCKETMSCPIDDGDKKPLSLTWSFVRVK